MNLYFPRTGPFHDPYQNVEYGVRNHTLPPFPITSLLDVLVTFQYGTQDQRSSALHAQNPIVNPGWAVELKVVGIGL